MTRFLILLCILFLWKYVQNLRFGSFKGVPYIFNYTEGKDWCDPSFECDIISHLCSSIAKDENNCKLTVFDNLEDRITSLEKNEVDIVVGRFRVSTDRAKRIDFVRPYYYSSGAQLLTLPGNEDLFTSFEDLISQPVCMELGFYAAQTLSKEYGLYVFPSIKESFAELIQDGYCVAAVTNSVFILDGLVQTSVSPVYEQPYSIAISKTSQIQNLGTIVQNTLLQMLVNQNGENGQSVLEELEEKYLIPQGINRNEKLAQLSKDITENNGEYIGVEAEDDIWDADNLTALSRRFAEDLVFTDTAYDEFCRQALTEIYESHKNGTQIGNLTMTLLDSVAYTFITSVDDPQNWLPTYQILQHPFIEPGSTALQIAKTDPQFLTTIQIIQDAYLADEKRFLEGAEFYSAQPFDGSQGIDEKNRVRFSLLSPTRVIKTVLWKIIQQKVDDNDMLVVGGCGVGEKRNW
eukprot:TRINITY_DN16713_c1_g1_i1.p1 TRINITY_DN16713_c1_g1~~TRINITY_DN16713_c1_g1_i1.p1  ORF type:complete len:462 (+),score=47.68 TRINITY_DN16713_c1_g1_i1:319-1704(+)